MAQRFLNDTAGFGVGYPIIGANSVTFTEADPVYINTSGFLALGTSSDKVLGFSTDTISTLASDNQTVAKVCPKYLYHDAVLVVYPLAAAAAATQTMIGEYVVISGTTSGAFTVGTNSATVGQFLVVGINPNNNGSVTDGTTAELSELVLRVAFPQTWTVTSS